MEESPSVVQQKHAREASTDVSLAVAVKNGFLLNCSVADSPVVLLSEIFN